MPSLLYVYQDSMHKNNVSVSNDDFKDLKKYIEQFCPVLIDIYISLIH